MAGRGRLSINLLDGIRGTQRRDPARRMGAYRMQHDVETCPVRSDSGTTPLSFLVLHPAASFGLAPIRINNGWSSIVPYLFPYLFIYFCLEYRHK